MKLRKIFDIKKYLNKIKNMFLKLDNLIGNKKCSLLIKIILIVIVIGLITIVSVNLYLNKDRSDILRKKSWREFVINIDGKDIAMGDKMSEVEDMGFNAIDQYYNEKIEPNYVSGGIAFEYGNKRDDGVNILFLSVYNSSSVSKKMSDSELNGVDLTSIFFNNYQVILPGGFVLNNDLRIKKIIRVWGKPTDIDNVCYIWKYNDGKIKICINSDDTIFSVVYDC